MAYEDFAVLLRFFIKSITRQRFEENKRNMPNVCKYEVTLGNKPSCSPCFPLASRFFLPLFSLFSANKNIWRHAEKCRYRRFLTRFRHFPDCLLPSSIVDKLSNTLVAFSKRPPIPFRLYLEGHRKVLRQFAMPCIIRYFLYSFLEKSALVLKIYC
jgi:hypothetical protein